MDEIQTYLGADGLMHCTVCKEPVEAFYPKGSLLEMKKHHRQCACERQAYAEEAQYFKEKERRELVVRNKKICFEEKEMEGFTFQNVDRDSSAIRIAEEYVANWQKMKQNHMGYLFWGPVGTGKSYLAACIANALLEQEVTVKMTNFNTILNDLFAAEDKTEYIRSLNGYELLIIDDLGVERNHKWDNVKHISEALKENGRPRKVYQSGLWGLSIKTKERLDPKAGRGLRFGIVVTLREMNGENRIDDFIKMCMMRGWIVNRLDVQAQADVYFKAEEEITFE